jgi:hypothetical protein
MFLTDDPLSTGAEHPADQADSGARALVIGLGSGTTAAVAQRLADGEEKIFEAYYSYKLNRWSALTFDYQFIADPAYNADRGPVSIFSARAHAEF